MLLFFMRLMPGIGSGELTVMVICLGFCLAAGNVCWLAAYTETAEAINPALVATALAIQSAAFRLSSIGTAAAQVLVVGDGQEWTSWWWLCIACLLAYLPSIMLLAGSWRPAHARAVLAS
jgi:hypothetical protein